MLLGERDHDIGVGRAHRRRVAVDGVDAAVGQADLIEDVEQLIAWNLAADGLLHQIADARGLFDAGAGLGAQMQLELAGVARPGRNPGRARDRAENRKGRPSRKSGTKTDRGDGPGPRGSPDSRRADARNRARRPSGAARRDCGWARDAAASAGISPASAPAFAKGRTTPASRTPPLRPAARTGSAPRRSGRTSAGNTMQMQSVETSAGTAICGAPSRMACSISLPSSRLRLTFSISTVASSTRIPTASASPPSVMMLMVSCRKLSTMMEVRIESGMETAMISVLRQLPGRAGSSDPVRQAAITASRITPAMEARTKMD